MYMDYGDGYRESSHHFFEKYVLDNQCKKLVANRGAGSKTESDKVHNKPHILDGDIFKLGTVIKTGEKF